MIMDYTYTNSAQFVYALLAGIAGLMLVYLLYKILDSVLIKPMQESLRQAQIETQ